eukprot:4046378-Pyramimonas_sp.AAC.1
MALVHTHIICMGTCYSRQRTCTNVDYVAIPSSALHRIQKRGVDDLAENPTLTSAPRAKWNTHLLIRKWVKDPPEFHRFAQPLQEWSMSANGGGAVQSFIQQGRVEDARHIYNLSLIHI